MKTQLLSTALLLALANPIYASGSHTGGHDNETKTVEEGSHGHTEGHGEEGHHEMAAGMAGVVDKVSRTIEVSMIETDDGDMIFEPKSLDIKAGETVRFAINNTGELEHEFVLDTVAKNAEHKKLMEEFPEMEHDDPNSVRLEEGQTGEIIWSFTNTGAFEFACLIPGHYEAGMHSNIVVADAGDATTVEYTKGVVKKIDPKSGKVTIIHEELKSLGMPAMTMVFRVSDDAMLEQMNAGDNIEFVAERLKGKLVIMNLK